MEPSLFSVTDIKPLKALKASNQTGERARVATTLASRGYGHGFAALPNGPNYRGMGTYTHPCLSLVSFSPYSRFTAGVRSIRYILPLIDTLFQSNLQLLLRTY